MIIIIILLSMYRIKYCMTHSWLDSDSLFCFWRDFCYLLLNLKEISPALSSFYPLVRFINYFISLRNSLEQFSSVIPLNALRRKMRNIPNCSGNDTPLSFKIYEFNSPFDQNSCFFNLELIFVIFSWYPSGMNP